MAHCALDLAGDHAPQKCPLLLLLLYLYSSISVNYDPAAESSAPVQLLQSYKLRQMVHKEIHDHVTLGIKRFSLNDKTTASLCIHHY